jgi:hypothetical protein
MLINTTTGILAARLWDRKALILKPFAAISRELQYFLAGTTTARPSAQS